MTAMTTVPQVREPLKVGGLTDSQIASMRTKLLAIVDRTPQNTEIRKRIEERMPKRKQLGLGDSIKHLSADARNLIDRYERERV